MHAKLYSFVKGILYSYYIAIHLLLLLYHSLQTGRNAAALASYHKLCMVIKCTLVLGVSNDLLHSTAQSSNYISLLKRPMLEL